VANDFPAARCRIPRSYSAVVNVVRQLQIDLKKKEGD
jgi:hypothetical protein